MYNEKKTTAWDIAWGIVIGVIILAIIFWIIAIIMWAVFGNCAYNAANGYMQSWKKSGGWQSTGPTVNTGSW